MRGLERCADQSDAQTNAMPAAVAMPAAGAMRERERA